MKKNTIKTKIIASVLAAVTVCSVGTMATTSAFASETHISAGTTVTKGVTIRKLLENNGFNVSSVPKDTNLVTAKAFDDSVSNASQLLGYNYQKTCYKGVNIDAKGAGEANVQLIDCGYNSWKFSEWNYSLPGNACAMVIK